MDLSQYQQARTSRDATFDGVIFVASKQTGSFCRTVCPVIPANDVNVEYFATAAEALLSGYKPCPKCRPESSPFSPAWNEIHNQPNDIVNQALNVIHQNGFNSLKLAELAKSLGITDRYLRKLFEQTIGISPKTYVQRQQALFAKALLMQTHLPANKIAIACGYNNVRRFNDGFKRIVDKTPSQVRKMKKSDAAIRLQLNYQPPYDWQHFLEFVTDRQLKGIESLGRSSYGRTFVWPTSDGNYIKGYFNGVHRPDKQGFNVSIEIDDIKYLYPVVQRIRQVLDLPANVESISKQLAFAGIPEHKVISGLRIPSCWSPFEAAIRAVLGQQVSVKQATSLVNQLVTELGDKQKLDNDESRVWFPTPEQVVKSRLTFLKIPTSRKTSLKEIAKWFIYNRQPNIENIEDCLQIKGIGQWTVDYVNMRGLENSDIWLESDLGIKKALDIFPAIEPDKAKPYRSYLTFNMWHMM